MSSTAADTGKKEASEYVILEQRKQAGTASATGVPTPPAYWVDVSRQKAASADAAVRSYAAGQADPQGTYVAIPARSWQPKTLKVETRKVLHLA